MRERITLGTTRHTRQPALLDTLIHPAFAAWGYLCMVLLVRPGQIDKRQATSDKRQDSPPVLHESISMLTQPGGYVAAMEVEGLSLTIPHRQGEE